MARLALAGILLALWPALAAAVEPTPARQGELLHLLKHDCGSCHGLTRKGGLGPPLLPADLAGQDPAVLALVILEGVAGTPMPPWKSELSAADAVWLAERLQQGEAP